MKPIGEGRLRRIPAALAFRAPVKADRGLNRQLTPTGADRVSDYRWGCSSVGEHLLCKQGVTGSSPVSSTSPGRDVLYCEFLAGSLS